MEQQTFTERLRQWMNEGAGKTVTIIACLVLLGGAGYGISRQFSRKGSLEASRIRGKGRSTFYLCKACGKTGKTRISFDDRFPIICPECKEKEAVGAFSCRQCQRTIEAQPKPLYRCPHCKAIYDNRMSGGTAPPGE